MAVVDLTPATRDLLGASCRHCAWWQTSRDAGDREGWPALRREWERTVGLSVGLFGKALTQGDAVLGWVQAAPALLVPRAHRLPAGPPGQDAWLLTCAYLYDEEYLRGFQRLLHELQADLKIREVAALEAFALCGASHDDRFRGYFRELNLFNRETLEGGGFRPVGLSGDVARYRLDLATLIAEPRRSRLREAWEAAAPQPI